VFSIDSCRLMHPFSQTRVSIPGEKRAQRKATMAMRRHHTQRSERPLPRAALIAGALALWLALGVISQAAFQLLG
jgi:hypothetical protein